MDQIQQSLCDMTKRKPACLTDRTIFRSALADYLPSNKLKQNLLLNAFDNDVVQSLRKGSDVTLSALNCISQLENNYGITKDAAFWAVQTWCYILGLDKVADALVVLQPQNQLLRILQIQPFQARKNIKSDWECIVRVLISQRERYLFRLLPSPNCVFSME